MPSRDSSDVPRSIVREVSRPQLAGQSQISWRRCNQSRCLGNSPTVNVVTDLHPLRSARRMGVLTRLADASKTTPSKTMHRVEVEGRIAAALRLTRGEGAGL